MNKTISEIIEEWDQGIITTLEVYPALLDLALDASLDDIIPTVPEPWRSRFVDWIAETYDNDIPIQDFVWLESGRVEPEGARRVISVAREWLQRRRSGDGA